MTRQFSHMFTNVHRQVYHRGKATRTLCSEAFALNSVGLFPEVLQQKWKINPIAEVGRDGSRYSPMQTKITIIVAVIYIEWYSNDNGERTVLYKINKNVLYT